jgi:hypothetical protein
MQRERESEREREREMLLGDLRRLLPHAKMLIQNTEF